MATPPTDEQERVLTPAMTPWEGLTPLEMRLVLALEEARTIAKELGIGPDELYDAKASWRLRVDAWLWRSSKWLRKS
mgnify:FL=1